MTTVDGKVRRHLLVWVAVIIGVTVVRDIVFRWWGAPQEILLADMEWAALGYGAALALATCAVVTIGWMVAFSPVAPRWVLPVTIAALCVMTFGALGVNGHLGLDYAPQDVTYPVAMVAFYCMPGGYLLLLAASLGVATRVNSQVGWGIGLLVPADLVLGSLLMFNPVVPSADHMAQDVLSAVLVAGIIYLAGHVLIVIGARRAVRDARAASSTTTAPDPAPTA